MLKVFRTRIQTWRARRAERRALLRLGESLLPSADVALLDERLRTFNGALHLSLARDRADYAAVAAWAGPLVVLRGIFERWVLRALRHRVLRDRADARVRQGENAMGTARGALADAARDAVQHSLEVAAQVRPMPAAVREVQRFAAVLWKEARGQVLPRAPALVGLLVGWWIADTFTDSEFSATLHTWGIGEGPHTAVTSSTLQAMNFGLPLLAAAACSYAGSRLAALVRARYQAPPQP